MCPNRILLLIALLPAGAAVAERPIQEVNVTADHAGPALWKVTSGQHLLWILADPPTPLRAHFVWRTKQVEAAIANAQELILDGGITFSSRISDTPLTAATYQDLRMIPGQLTSLQDVLPAGLYRRFESLKDAFAPNYDSMEQLRPWAAGFELRKHVMRSLGVSDTAVADTIVRLGWRAKLITLYTYANYAQFQKNSKSGRTLSCLEEIVSELEADRDELPRLENAWSVGDADALREVTLRLKSATCALDMFDNDEQAKDATAHHAEQWLTAVDAALTTYKTTFALVPADKIFAPDDWLSALRARGYDVQAPR